ncbi:myomegalin [Elysia marginata]|uniref:Myomegalin n=1 Tax=Elysia marginata TaxID=1093978 RepID=A0AAV4HKW3_9GAST|nr:myomegalin [Elysia marginata]
MSNLPAGPKDAASSAELLLTEISSVQNIYRQLEGGVQKNSQLHQALLNSLRGDRRQSDSPDSNSCQDGGYNLAPSGHLVDTTSDIRHQKQPVSSATGRSVGSNTSLAQVDRSFQTGTALSHLDQGVQTSPASAQTVDAGTSATDISFGNENTTVKTSLVADQPQGNKPQPNSLLISPSKYPNLVPSHRLRHSHVHFADTGDNLDIKSLTDDAKGIRPVSAENSHNLDYFNCSPGVLFDEVNFDVRAHDCASSTRFNTRATISPTANLSNTASHSSIISSTKSALPATPRQGPEKTYASTRNGPSQDLSGHQDSGDEALDQNGSSNRIGDVIDFNNHRSNSFVSPGSKIGQSNGQSSKYHNGKSLIDQQLEDRSGEKAESPLVNRSGEKGDQRSRRNSWAEELEQYRVHDQDRGADQPPQSDQQQQQLQQQTQVIASMSAVELRDLVAQLQVDLVDAVKENKALHEELKALPKRQSVVNGSVNANNRADIKSRIPRLHASSSRHSTTSEDSDHVDGSRNATNVSSEYRSQQNSNIPRGVRNRTASADRGTSSTLQSRLSDSCTLIKNLQDKLHATENTVRLLSKKNKAYVSALESVGISPRVLNRSNSESCLSSFVDASQEKIATVAGLNSPDQNRRLAYLLSPLKNRELSGSREKSRAISSSMPTFDTDLFQSSPPVALAKSPTTSTATSCSPVRNTDMSACSSASYLPQMQSTTNVISQTLSSVDISEPGVYFKVPAVPPSTSFRSTGSGSSPTRKTGPASDQFQQLNEDRSSIGLGDDTKSPPRSSPSKDKSSTYNQINASLIDVSAYPDVTYTSLLDGTLLNRLHHMTNMDHSMSTTMNEDVSSMNVDQLQGRLEHLERVNLTLREEINVYEAIYRSQGTQVTTSFFDSSDKEQERPKSDDDLLKQHLVEIKKLRQRLERLDITKDPEQLLIFQSHTQQRITRQEAMLAHLQQQLVEKEERHLQECAQLQHRLAREKVAVGERLEQTVADLRKQLDAQMSTVEKYEQHVQELKLQLQLGEEREKKQEEEITKIMSEKAELGDDLVKRDKEFLEMEKLMFRLEMAKESSESACRQTELDLEEREKECNNLRKEIEESKENSKCLKEIVVKREKSLQEKIYSLQKMTNEKAALAEHIREKENQVKKSEEALGNLRKEMHDIHSTYDNMKMQLQSEIQELKSDLRNKEELEARNAFQKAAYEAEAQRLTEEKVQMKAAHEQELDNERMDTRRQLEDLRSQLKDKKQIESELEMLRERAKTLSALQCKVEKLESQLDHKASRESELLDQLDSLSGLQDSFDRNQECLKSVQMEKTKIHQDLKEREEKLRKRDKQLKNLIDQHKKLEATFSKQKNMLKEKTELIYSQKKQLRLFEVSLTASSQEEKNDIMKQLLKELIATQRQVEELLSRLEQNPLSQPTVVVETLGLGKVTTGAGVTTTVTTTSETRSSSSSGQDNVDTVLSVGVREGSPEICRGSLSPSASEGELDMPTSSLVGGHTVASSSSSSSSPLRPVSTNLSPVPPSHYPLSPRHLRYYADIDSELIPGQMPQSMVGSDIRSLFAVLKLEAHEKLRKMSSESLVVLSTVEARLEDRLRSYKAMAVSESVDYSTLRETSMSCRNLRLCLEEAVKLVASAWITELPPVDARGHFYDPVLAEQNENLKRDLTLLRSRHDVLDHTVKEQQGRLQASKERHKNWEQSLYKQLHKTAQDMEKAKENFDAAGLVSKKSQSLRVRSPNISPRKRHDETL